MHLTLQWLNRHLKHQTDIAQICSTLNSLGLEVEEAVELHQNYHAFIVVKILSAEKHPQADRLQICQVQIDENGTCLQIVCGAPNARPGLYTILAPVGTTIPANDLTIKAAKIRGVSSEGMLCSAQELGLQTNYFIGDADGIVELDSSSRIGMSLLSCLQLDDTLIDVKLTPNRRRDAASVFGIARDLAAAGLGTLVTESQPTHHIHPPKSSSHQATLPGLSHSSLNFKLLDTDNCHDISFFAATGLQTHSKAECADKQREISLLLRKINKFNPSTLVNLSNFAMFDWGRPTHFYDLDKIKGTVSIRPSRAGEEFMALNGTVYTLPADVTVIADEEKILSIAGIIGGELSKIDSNTQNILVEIGNFRSTSIARTTQQMNLSTDASFRFEGGVDQGNLATFTPYLQDLLLQFFVGNISQTVTLTGAAPEHPKNISLDPTFITRIVGQPILQARDILTALGFVVTDHHNGIELAAAALHGHNGVPNDYPNLWNVEIPSWRQGDIALPQDIVEEVLRVYGLNSITAQPLKLMPIPDDEYQESVQGCTIMPAATSHIGKTELARVVSLRDYTASSVSPVEQARNILLARGLDETMTWPFTSQSESEEFAFAQPIHIKNPLNTNISVMRGSLLPKLLQVIVTRQAYSQFDSCIFELGHVYSWGNSGYQKLSVAAIRSGAAVAHKVHGEDREWDFYDIRDDFISCASCFTGTTHIEDYSFENTAAPDYYHPGQSTKISIGGQTIGYCGLLHPQVAANHALKHDKVYVFELYPMSRHEVEPSLKLHTPHQLITRDFAFLIPQKVPAITVLNALKSLKDKVLDDYYIFDIYQGNTVKEGCKSIAIRVRLLQHATPLTAEAINKASEMIVRTVEQATGGTLRDA